MWIFEQSNKHFFTPEERAQVAALLEAILPGDEQSPGATDVMAVEFLDRLLARNEGTYYEIPAWQKLYRESLPPLDRASAAIFGGLTIAQLGREQVTQLVQALSQGQIQSAALASPQQQRLFAVLRAHCIEGCFADPRWGGNAEGGMWRWFGYLQLQEPYRPAQQPPGAVATPRLSVDSPKRAATVTPVNDTANAAALPSWEPIRTVIGE
jgi:gluconate 2-dehydrogenase gamma chain